MIAWDNVDAFFVSLGPMVLATSPIIKASKKLLVGHTWVTSFLRTNPYAFRGMLNVEESVRAARGRAVG